MEPSCFITHYGGRVFINGYDLIILNLDDAELERFRILKGMTLRVNAGDIVKSGQVLSDWEIPFIPQPGEEELYEKMCIED